MADVFDPYHKWLGISPKDQPPHHYRLLGIDSFEADPQVIELAADRQMVHLRNFQSGPHSQESQRLLNEVAQARVCLLNAPKKAAYDAALRKSLQPALPTAKPLPESGQAGPQAAALPNSQPAFAMPVVSTTPTAPAGRYAAQRRRHNSNAKILAGVGVGGVLLIAVLLLAWRNGEKPEGPSDRTPAVAQAVERPSRLSNQASELQDRPANDGNAASPSTPDQADGVKTHPTDQVNRTGSISPSAVEAASGPNPSTVPQPPDLPKINLPGVDSALSSNPSPTTTPAVPPAGSMPPDGFASLFNGKDRTGWNELPQQTGDWSVEDGLLIGRSGTAHHLFSDRGDFRNFHLRVEALLEDNGNSGIKFRCERGLNLQGRYPLGYEAQILNTHPQAGASRTGSLFKLQDFDRQVVQPSEWFRLEVIAQGQQIVIKVNGATTADYFDPSNTYQRGHIALQAMGPPATVVKFRKIEIKEFPEAVAPSSGTDVPKTAEPSKPKAPGVFTVSALSTPKKERLNFILEMRDDGAVLREKAAIGRWEKQAKGYIITPDDSEKDKVTITPRGRGLWSAVEIDDDGTRWAWEMQQVTLAATWDHIPSGGRRGPVRLWSNGRLQQPDGKATWTLQGNKLTMRWANGFVDTVTISSDGRRYEGRNQYGAVITGRLVEEPQKN